MNMDLAKTKYVYDAAFNAVVYVCENNLDHINIDLLRFIYAIKFNKPKIIKQPKEYIHVKAYNDISSLVFQYTNICYAHIGIYTIREFLKHSILDILIRRRTIDFKKFFRYKDPMEVINYTKLLAKFINQFVFEEGILKKKKLEGKINLNNILNISNN